MQLVRTSRRRAVPIALVRACVAAVALAAIAMLLLGRPAYVALTPSGAFARGGTPPSHPAAGLPVDAYGSWTSAGGRRGQVLSEPFAAPAALVFAIEGHPGAAGGSIGLVRADGSFVPFGIAGDLGTAWTYGYAPVPDVLRGTSVRFAAVAGAGAWLGVGDVRAARPDERLLGAAVATPWAYVGLAYLAAYAWAALAIARGTGLRRSLRDPVYLGALAFAAWIAWVIGVASADVVDWYASWGRAALDAGPASAYDLPAWSSDNPPVNTATTVVAAIANALHLGGPPPLGLFGYKLVPLASLAFAPLLARAALARAGVTLGPWAFRGLVVCTVLNPALLYDVPVWGQTDVVIADAVLLAAAAFLGGRSVLGGAAYAAAVLTKPQPLLALPVVAVMALRRGPLLALAGALAALAAVLPAIPETTLPAKLAWLADLYRRGSAEHAFASLAAGTLPGALSGGTLRSGEVPGLFGFTVDGLASVAVACGMLALAAAAWREREAILGPLALWYLATACTLLYWLAPHMHERYLVLGAVLAIVWAFARRGALATAAAAVLSFALIEQMTFGFTLIAALNHLPATLGPIRDVGFALAVATNALGLALLLVSRRRGRSDTPAGGGRHADIESATVT